ncbi:MAG: TolC family outer membrane protein [Zoogloeaceae bacterium]|jgi:outer membrane protein|nr:TolC family outer membrane protein [Zoogloeaceae bacterium]
MGIFSLFSPPRPRRLPGFFFPMAFCLLWPGALAAADLLEIYRLALQHDAQFAVARFDLEAGREKTPQGLSGLLPRITLSGDTEKNDNETRGGGLETHRQYNSNSVALTLTQPVFHWQNWLDYDLGRLESAVAEARFVAARQDLILRVAQAYFEVLNTQVTLEAARAQKLAIAQQLAQAKMNFEVGVTTIVDTYEAQSRYDLATAQEIASENELELRREALRVIIGEEVPETLAALDSAKSILPPDPAEMQPWVVAAQTENLTVQIQEQSVEIAGKELAKARAGHYPTLDVVARAERNRAPASNGQSRQENRASSIALQFNLPIFEGGYTSSRTRESAANHAAALSALENARRNAALLARQNFLGVVNGLAQIKALEAALTSSLSSLESNKLGYEVGVRINIDVLNAEQQVFSTRRDLARAYHDTLLAHLRLKNAIGTLEEKDVQEINALLQHE